MIYNFLWCIIKTQTKKNKKGIQPSIIYCFHLRIVHPQTLIILVFSGIIRKNKRIGIDIVLYLNFRFSHAKNPPFFFSGCSAVSEG